VEQTKSIWVELNFKRRRRSHCTLLAWHAADPVDDLERRRHQGIVEVQGNYNPFVDRPEFAAAIWGTAGRSAAKGAKTSQE